MLRAQISPHFVYNSLTAIASFVRTDPDRARDLLLDFADFTRYSFRSHGRFTTLAEELHSIEQYLLLEQARFGDRLTVALRVDPEVVGVRIPFLCIQPLVENAVRHGFENSDGPGTITITARDRGADALISVEDDGAGIDPAVVRRSLSGDPVTMSGWPTSTSGCAAPSATTWDWSWRPPPGRERGSPCGSPSTPRRWPSMSDQIAAPTGLRVLAVDDEPPALGELTYLLERSGAVAEVTPGSAAEALAALQTAEFDAVFLDIRMPGIDGLALAGILTRFAAPPPVVFVTAYDNHAVDAFEVAAVDYLLKPIRAERLALALTRVGAAIEARRAGTDREGAGSSADAGQSTGHEGTCGPRCGRPAGRRDDRRRARWRHPLHPPLRHRHAPGPARLRPAVHPLRGAPRTGPAGQPRGALGAGWVRARPSAVPGQLRVRRGAAHRCRSGVGGSRRRADGPREPTVHAGGARGPRAAPPPGPRACRAEPGRQRMTDGQRPRREVITGPRRDVRRRTRRSAVEDIDQQTRVGVVYVRALIRTQLLLGLSTVAVVVVPLAALPLLFGLVPGVRALQVGPLPLWWLLLGFLVYPAILGVGWWYIRHAERNEEQFTDLVEGR